LCEEHRATHPDGYGYSRFCELYRDFEARLSPTMRQTHVAGERLFVDYAGTTLDVIDGSTGEAMPAQLFVAALGASNYTYAEATWTQGLADWIGSHTRVFAFIGAVSAMVVYDNLKSGIAKACFYEPAVSGPMPRWRLTTAPPSYRRVVQARDKAKVEVAVQVMTRFIIAKLRNPSSADGVDAAIAELVAQLNDRMSRHLGASRRALFEELERPALKPLPAEPYVFAAWKECRVGLDYHVEIEKHYYSVPHQLLREQVWARITARTVELFHRGKRVAAHVRASSNRKHTTVREHMPSSHRRYADWTPERLRRQAGEIGQNAAALVEIILRERTHPEQGFRACIGILRLAKTYGRERSKLLVAGPSRSARAPQLGQFDSEEQSRSPTYYCSTRGRAVDRARQHPWTCLLQLGDDDRCSYIPPLISSEHSSSTAWRKPSSNSRRKRRAVISRTPNGWRSCSTAKQPIATRSASKPDCTPPGCVTAKPPSRTSTSERRGGSTRHCSSSWRPAAGSPSAAAC
jgi:transposase